ncbi:hypothetical protein [Streptomyces sp. CBMA152]|uniref:hypothetical protein n=1 Tax=Streptomyces sp. CBMA152 TaxID=1896312 RepID=UPI0016615B57|nr:hypothetical protein [Streptomyces sp. CBMA152]
MAQFVHERGPDPPSRAEIRDVLFGRAVVEGGSGRHAVVAEAYADGTVRYRNEANHLCLLAPDADHGVVTLYKCEDIPAERWSVVNP